MAKLTLNIDPDTIEIAKKIAKQKHTSISKIVQSYLKSISRQEDRQITEVKDLAPEVISLTGLLKNAKLPDDYDYRQPYREHLEKKYGL